MCQVRDNVIWNVKGSNYYVEDGNERDNVFDGNIAVCPTPDSQGGCKAAGTDNTQVGLVKPHALTITNACVCFPARAPRGPCVS